jgi:magnesium transporter
MVRRWSYGSLVARTRLYREGKLVLEDFPVGDISEHLEDENACVWLDYCDPTKAELATIAEEFQLHPLAVEDAINAHQRPKLDRYDTHLFLSAYAVKLDTESGELCTHEVGAFITPQALVTVHMEKGAQVDSLLARWDASKEFAKHGVSFLLWGLLDDIVDGHFDAVQSLDSEIEALEDLLFDDRPRNRGSASVV